MKLRDLKAGDRFTAKFYATAGDMSADEPCLVIQGVFIGVYEENTDYCVVEVDGERGFEDSDLEVEIVEGGDNA